MTGKCSSYKDRKTGAPLLAKGECADCGVSVCELCYDCCSGFDMCSKLGKAKFRKKCATGPKTKIFKCQYSGLCEYWCMDCLVTCRVCKKLVCQYEHGGELGENFRLDCDEAEQAERGGADYWD